MAHYYYIDASGTQRGPVDVTQLTSCGVTGTTMVWTEGMGDWRPASQVIPHILNGGYQPQQPQCQPPQQPYQGGQQQPYGGYQYGNQNGATQYGANQYGTQYGNQYGNHYGNQYGNNQPAGPRPDNYMVWSIVITLVCCWPFGIVAIINSANVNKYWDQGRYDEAHKAANNAKTWCIVSAITGAIAFTIGFLSGFFGNL